VESTKDKLARETVLTHPRKEIVRLGHRRATYVRRQLESLESLDQELRSDVSPSPGATHVMGNAAPCSKTILGKARWAVDH
jgi:hypothetical protein